MCNIYFLAQSIMVRRISYFLTEILFSMRSSYVLLTYDASVHRMCDAIVGNNKIVSIFQVTFLLSFIITSTDAAPARYRINNEISKSNQKSNTHTHTTDVDRR